MIEGLTENLPAYVERPALPGPTGREGYGRIAFEKLPNTRDLGGMRGADGRAIKAGLLLRSGALGFASDADLALLDRSYHLALVVDLRNDEELAERPDPMDALPHARYVRANILPERTEGITQEEHDRAEAAFRAAEETGDRFSLMQTFYPFIVNNPGGIAGYRLLFQELLATEEGAALWHCSVGRDRCGMASVLVEHALGVAPKDIEADYLATNLYAPLEVTLDFPAAHGSLHAALEALDRDWGGIDGYLRDALGVTADDIATLRARYLTA